VGILEKYSSVAEIFQAMEKERLDGISLADIIGGGSPLEVAADSVRLISMTAGLHPTDNILDLGCGCGRYGTALTQHIASTSKYYGIDIVPALIEFAQRRITSKFGNFQFFTIEQNNSSYDYYRTASHTSSIRNISEICASGSIDLCIATSLFTHLDFAVAKRYLEDIYAALQVDGRAYLTFFLLDATTRALMKGGQPSFTFGHASLDDGVYYDRPDAPMHAVAFDETTLRAVLSSCGFYIDQIQYGSWAGRRNAQTYQDVVVARRMPLVVGYVDVANVTGVTGWVAAKSGSSEPIKVNIYADGKVVATLCADEFRSDLVSVGYGTGHHGFRWTPSNPLPENTIVTVYAESGEQIPVV
jgi:SAM-dependent methyltransferase